MVFLTWSACKIIYWDKFSSFYSEYCSGDINSKKNC